MSENPFGKDDQSAAQPDAASSSSIESIDEAARRWKEGDESASVELWDSVMKLDRWHFVSRSASDEENAVPFLGNNPETGPFVPVYTSSERAQAGAASLRLSYPKDGPIPTIEMPPVNAIRWITMHWVHGVRNAVFDRDDHGYYTSVISLAGLYERANGKAVTEDLVRPAAPGEFEWIASNARDQNSDAGEGRFLLRFLHLPAWHLLVDQSGSPTLLNVKGSPGLTIFTEQTAYQRTAESLSKMGLENASVAPIAVPAAIEFLKNFDSNQDKPVQLMVDPATSGGFFQAAQVVEAWNQIPNMAEKHAAVAPKSQGG